MIRHVALVIPAANEAQDIAACLSSVRVARSQLDERSCGRIRTRVIVALDDCTDGTADEVAAFTEVDTVRCAAHSAGGARRAGARAALDGGAPLDELLLVSTDADCLVPPDWLTGMVDEVHQGAEVVLGTVRPAPGLSPAAETAWYAAHHLADGHPHVHGANLAIVGDLYQNIGGWHDLAAHEDVDLVERVGGARIHRTDAYPVVTSTRLQGRTPAGFAGYLRLLEEAG